MISAEPRSSSIRRVSTAIGIYEKALAGSTWADRFAEASSAGYNFVELSVDDSPAKLRRLDCSSAERQRLRRQAEEAGSRIGTIVLSAHRAFPWGSRDAPTRQRADVLAHQSLILAADLGAERVQIAGYFTFDGPRHPDARGKFVEGLKRAATFAGDLGVALALENVDGSDVVSASDCIGLLADIDSPSVSLYIDVGNYAGNALSVVDELRLALPYAHAVQFKDARPQTFRRVPFGRGTVPWPDVFSTLESAGYQGPVSVEMWNDNGEPGMAADALRWLERVAS